MAKGILQLKVLGDASHAVKAMDGLDGSLNRLKGAAVALGGVLAAAGLAGALSDCAQAAMEDEKAAATLANTLKNTTGATDDQVRAVEDYILKTELASGVVDDKLRPAFSNLVVATKDVREAQSTMAIAMDTAKGRGLDLEAVTVALGKAHGGNVTALQRLGIATKDAEGNTLSYDQVLQNLAETYGGSVAVAADTAQGKMERMKLAFAEVKEGVGTALLPIIEKFAQFIIDNMPTIQLVMEGFASLVGKALNVLSEVVFPILQRVFEGFTTSVSEKTPGTNTLFEGIGTVVEGVQKVFEAVWPAIQKAVQLFIDFLTGPTGQALINGLMEGIGLVLETLSKVFSKVWPLAQQVIETFISFFNSDAGQALIDSLLGLIETALYSVQKVFEAVWPAVQVVVETFLKFFNSPTGQWLIKTLLGAIETALNAMAKIWDKVFKGLEPVLKLVGPLINIAMKPIIAAIDAVSWAIEKLKDAYYWLTGTQASVAYDASTMGSGYNPSSGQFDLSQQLNGPDRGPVKKYAHGGSVSTTGPAILHGGEYVLTRGDTSLMQRLISAVERGSLGRGGIVVNINGQGAAAGEAAADALLTRLAAAGVRL